MSSSEQFSRREFLTATAAGTAAVAIGVPALAGCAPHAELWELSAAEAAAAMKRGDITAERYAASLLARCKAAESLNGFITLKPELVLAQARQMDVRRASGAPLGALHGLPIPVKDSVNTKDLPTTGGTPALRNFQPAADAPLVAKLRDAGAIVLGKTNLHELSIGYTSNNLATGPVHNPYDVTRSPGGSSGGSAAAVAARLAPLSVAEDTAGSVRVPAAMCGIVGFRPTTGRYPTQGVIPMTPLFDQLGPHARNVGDVMLFDATITGDQTPVALASIRGVKFAVVRDYYFAAIDPETARVMDDAVRKLTDAGAVIVELKIPDLADLINKTTFGIILHDLAPNLAAYLAEYHVGIPIERVLGDVSANIKALFAATATSVPDDATYHAMTTAVRPALQARLADAFKASGASGFVFPATPVPAVPIGQGLTITVAGAEVPFDPYMGRNVVPGSTAGLPGLVLPAGLTRAGLPVGIEFDGPSGSDRALLALGLSIEQALGTIPEPKMA